MVYHFLCFSELVEYIKPNLFTVSAYCFSPMVFRNDCKQSRLDKALFRWYNKKGQIEGLRLLHVDDFHLAGSDNFAVFVTKKIEDAFRIRKRKVINF